MTPGPATFTLAAPAATTAQWQHLDLPAIAQQLEQTGVYAPEQDVPGLTAVVDRADGDGHDLYVVVLDESFSPFTVYRDIATELQQQTGGTVLVFGPNTVGTASDDFSRVQLEDGTSSVVMSNPVTATQQIYDRATDPYVNWTVLTVVMIVVVLVGAALARLMMLRARRVDDGRPVPTAGPSGDDVAQPDPATPDAGSSRATASSVAAPSTTASSSSDTTAS